MEELKKKLSLRCVFCRSTLFALPFAGYRPCHGSFVICANCGRENDFTSLMLVIEDKAFRIAEKYAEKVMTEAAKDMTKQLQKALNGNKNFKVR